MKNPTALQKFLIPKRGQWKRWGFLSRVAFVGSWASIIGIPLTVLLALLPSCEKGGGVHVENKGLTNSPVQTIIGNSNTQVLMNNPQIAIRDFIADTSFTSSDLDQIFPFGWVVFSNFDGDKWTHEVDPHGRTRYLIDWNLVTISPDIQSKRMTWTIPDISWSSSNANRGLHNMSVDTYPMEIGRTCRVYVVRTGNNQPMPFVTTLSDNQRKPVFALGFRIVK